MEHSEHFGLVGRSRSRSNESAGALGFPVLLTYKAFFFRRSRTRRFRSRALGPIATKRVPAKEERSNCETTFDSTPADVWIGPRKFIEPNQIFKNSTNFSQIHVMAACGVYAQSETFCVTSKRLSIENETNFPRKIALVSRLNVDPCPSQGLQAPLGLRDFDLFENEIVHGFSQYLKSRKSEL